MPITPNSLEDFSDRFDALMEEAKGYGIESACVLLDDNPISGNTGHHSMWNGCAFRALGAVSILRMSLAKTIDGSEVL